MEPDEEAAELLASTFHELREGVSSMGHRIDSPGSVMSTAEAVSVYYQTMMNAYYYGDGHMEMDCMVQNLVGAVQKESREDLEKLRAISGKNLWEREALDAAAEYASETGKGGVLSCLMNERHRCFPEKRKKYEL